MSAFRVVRASGQVDPKLVQAATEYWQGTNTEDGFVFKENVSVIAARHALPPWRLSQIVKQVFVLVYAFKCACGCGCGKECQQEFDATRATYRAVYIDKKHRPHTRCADCDKAALEESQRRTEEAEQERQAAAQAEHAAARLKAQERYGRYFVSDCPCGGFRVIRFKKSNGWPFKACTNWRPTGGCQYSDNLTATEHARLVEQLEHERDLFLWRQGLSSDEEGTHSAT